MESALSISSISGTIPSDASCADLGRMTGNWDVVRSRGPAFSDYFRFGDHRRECGGGGWRL